MTDKDFTTVEVGMTATAMRARSQTLPGVLWALASAMTFGLSGVIGKPMLQSGWSTGAVVWIRLAGGALVLAVPVIRVMRGRWNELMSGASHLIGYGLVAVGICQYCFFQAVRYLPVGVALLLEFCGPILVVVWMWGIRRDRPSPIGIAGMLVALAGLVLVLGVTGGQLTSLVGVLWGMGAAIGNAGYFLMSVGSKSPLPPVVQAGFGLGIGAVLLAGAGLAGVMPLHTGTAQISWQGVSVPLLVMAALLAVLVTVVPYTTGIAGIRRLGSRVSSFLGLTEVLFAVLFAWLLLAEVPTPYQLIGGLLICGGVLLVKVGEPEPGRAVSCS